MTLREKQSLFAQLFARLILKVPELGMECTIGEVERPQVAADAYAAAGKGIKNSLHRVRLAADLHLFLNGQYLADTEAHRPLGEWWEAQHELCRWGGRFKDGNHYSLEHEGRA